MPISNRRASRRGLSFGLAAALLAFACSSGEERSNGGDAGAPAGTTSSGGIAGTGAIGGSAGAQSGAGGSAAGSSGVSGAAGALGGAGGASAGGAGASGSAGAASGASGSGGASGDGAGGDAGAGSGAAGGGGAGAAGASGDAGSAGQGGTGGSAGQSSCTTSTLMAGDHNRTLMIGGTSRTYILHVPSSYDGKTPVPLVLDFHGLGGSGMQEESSSGYRQVADREGFLVAFPDGIDSAWNIGPCCTNSRDVDDLGFAKGMVQSIASDGCVDLLRVYSVGFSMGGGMSHFLACNAADVFAAVAPSAFDLLVEAEEPCAPSRPISVIAFRGTGDTVVPFAGGKGSSGRITFLGAQASFERWAGLDGCVAPTTMDGECTTYEQCDSGVQVGLCVKQGGMHAAGDATVGWTFLSKFTLP